MSLSPLRFSMLRAAKVVCAVAVMLGAAWSPSGEVDALRLTADGKSTNQSGNDVGHQCGDDVDIDDA